MTTGEASARRGRRASALVASASIAIALMSATVVATIEETPPVAAATYFNRYGAVADADYSWNKSYPKPWQRFGGSDCANFVSQAWYFGGGMNMRSGWYLRSSDAWWRGHRDFSHTWIRALGFSNYWVNARVASYYHAPPNRKYTPAWRGDAILYDWGEGEGWSHLAILTGWNSSGDYINQHSKDRQHSAWNLGWRTQRNPQVRSRMNSYVVHVNT